VNPSEITEVLEKRGAIQRGHFLLSSGRHSDVYVEKFRVFEHPRLTQSFGEAISERFDGRFDAVLSPALGAIVLGFATALAADARFLIAERAGGAMLLRRGFEVAAREAVLVVEDVVTTGGSAREVVELARNHGGEVVGVGALIDRSAADQTRDEPPAFGATFQSLLRLEASSWEEESCPMCARNQPLSDPGSRRLSA
jgi:orotate phosphoribosyltransferase